MFLRILIFVGGTWYMWTSTGGQGGVVVKKILRHDKARYGVLVVFLTVVATVLPVRAYSQIPGVTILVNAPPPNNYRMADLWRGHIVNATPNTYRVYLRATVEELAPGSGLVVDARSTHFDLQPGVQHLVGAQLEPFTVDTYNREYYNVIQQSGSMPSGTYRGCTEVIDVTTSAVLATYCTDVSIERVSQPFLVSPSDQQVVGDQYPVFTWMGASPPTIGASFTYRLRLFEIFGDQTPQDASVRNPAFLDVPGLVRTVYMYPISARAFERGQRYAWYVTAYERRGTSLIEVGASEIWEFTTAQRSETNSVYPATGYPRNECTVDNWDFETSTLACWIPEGELIDLAPVKGNHPLLGPVGHRRQYWYTTFGTVAGDALVGEVRSAPFTIHTNYVSMLVGGSTNPECVAELVVEWSEGDTLNGPRRRLPGLVGKFVVVANSVGDTTEQHGETLQEVRWDLRSYKERRAVILIRDWSRSAHLNVDAVRFHDEQEQEE